MELIRFFVLYLFLCLNNFSFSFGFVECPNGNTTDPNVPGVTISDCISWAAYQQSINVNIPAWCSDPIVATKCCITCGVIYAGFTQCDDVATNCPSIYLANNKNCSRTVNGLLVSSLCPKTCGICNPLTGPSCSGLPSNVCGQNGNCSNTTKFNVTTISCTCLPGWTGSNCMTDIDECSSSPCKNGICINQIGSYSCVCSNGYTGSNCMTDIDECSSSPCKNGTCINQIGSYSCVCNSGWTGSNCMTDIDECSSSPCKNGICINQIGSYSCVCNSGWSGVNCAANIQSCSPNPCQNGGTCTSNGCICNSQFNGTNCETSVGIIGSCSASKPCQNGGICLTNGTCLCPTNYTGPFCEISSVNYTQASCLCQNGGICIAGNCICLPEFVGPYCETHKPACYSSSNSCQNGGTCLLGVCICPVHYTGINCEIHDSCTDILSCILSKASYRKLESSIIFLIFTFWTLNLFELL